MRRAARRGVAVGAAAALLCAGAVSSAEAAGGRARPATPITIQVTTFTDSGACPSMTHCSLRGAIQLADSNAGDDTILVPAGTYKFASATQLPFTDSVTLTKTGSGAQATIDAQGQTFGVRAFTVANNANVTMNNIGITNGKPILADTDGFMRGGGGRVNRGSSLAMNGGSITNNKAISSDPNLGGGIFVAGQLTLNRVLVEQNEAGGGTNEKDSGGGIYADLGTVTVNDSVITGNESSTGGGVATDGSLNVTRSTVDGNDGFQGGGGIAVTNCGEAMLNNVTVSGNGANDGSAGGISTVNAEGARLASSSIVHNSSLDLGAGIVSHQTNTSCPTGVFLHDSIVAENVDRDTTGNPPMFPDCWDEDAPTALFTSQGYNVIGDPNGCDLTPSTGDHVGTHAAPLDPGVAALSAFNGGPLTGLRTDALVKGSVSINNGDPAAGVCGSTDERGVPRTMGGRCDIGAYEFVTCHGVVVDRVGSNGNDSSSSPRMAPTSGADGILGLGGNDNLAGAGGNDGLCGGSGNDHLDGGPGHDTCDGGPGRDSATDCEIKVSVP